MKPIKLTDSFKETAKQLFERALADYKGDSTFSFKLDSSIYATTSNMSKPVIMMTASAYYKMMSLVDTGKKELAWHGTVRKTRNAYIISDILCYPQKITSVTVESDDNAYGKWLMELDDDVINTMKFQGHSHVNMGVSPSGTDLQNWKKFLDILQDDEFYIFCIANKSREITWHIYDKADNWEYENSDIIFSIVDEHGEDISSFAKDSLEEYIKTDVTMVTQSNCYQGDSRPSYWWNADYNGHATSPKLVQSHTDCLTPAKSFDILPAHAGFVEYDADLHMYYAESYVSGFVMSNTWGCWICEEDAYKERYLQKKKKENRGRPKGSKNKK